MDHNAFNSALAGFTVFTVTIATSWLQRQYQKNKKFSFFQDNACLPPTSKRAQIQAPPTDSFVKSASKYTEANEMPSLNERRSATGRKSPSRNRSHSSASQSKKSASLRSVRSRRSFENVNFAEASNQNNPETSILSATWDVINRLIPRSSRAVVDSALADAEETSQVRTRKVSRFQPYGTSDAVKNSLPAPFRRRLNIVMELLNTERSYCQALERVLAHFYKPLMDATKTNEPILRKKDISCIFGNFMDILNVNRELLRQLEDRLVRGADTVNGPVPDTEIQKRSSIRRNGTLKKNLAALPVIASAMVDPEIWDPSADQIADIFVTMAPFLKVYSLYSQNFNLALEKLSQMLRSNETFRKFEQTQSHAKDMASLNLQAYLIMPIQRIPRYKMLLEDLLKHTSKEHAEYECLEIALGRIQNVAHFVNEEIRKHENFLSVIWLQLRMTGYKDMNGNTSLVMPGRKLLKRGHLMKVGRKEHTSRLFLLFNDILVYVVAQKKPLAFKFGSSSNSDLATLDKTFGDESYIFCRSFPLHLLKVSDAAETKLNHPHALLIPTFDNEILILSKEKSFQVYCASAEEKAEWITALQDAISAHCQSQEPSMANVFPAFDIQRTRAGSIEPDRDDFISPVWVPDDATNNCMCCNTGFSIVRRKHHCRRCGRLCCAACSAKVCRQSNLLTNLQTFVVPAYPDDRVERACDPCYFEMFQNEVANVSLYDEKLENSNQISTPLDISKRPRSISTRSLFLSESASSSTGIMASTHIHAVAEFSRQRTSSSTSELDQIDSPKMTVDGFAIPRIPERSQRRPLAPTLRSIPTPPTRLRYSVTDEFYESDTAYEMSVGSLSQLLGRPAHSKRPPIPNFSAGPITPPPRRSPSVASFSSMRLHYFPAEAFAKLKPFPELPEQDQCALCHQVFGLLRWRYKCEKCSSLVCGDCATKDRIPSSIVEEMENHYPSDQNITLNRRSVASAFYASRNSTHSPDTTTTQSVKLCNLCFHGTDHKLPSLGRRSRVGSSSSSFRFGDPVPYRRTSTATALDIGRERSQTIL